MSAILQNLPVLNTQHPYMLKDKHVDTFTPAFTAVNGRGSPPTPRDPIRNFGMSSYPSPITHHHEGRTSETGYQSGSTSSSPDVSSGGSSPESPKKRKLSASPEENITTDRGMEAPQHRPLPPIDRPSEHERRWTAEPQSRNGYQEMREPRPMDPIHGSMPPMAATHPASAEMNGFDSNSAEQTRAGVQLIDPKKRKRQFANRTKTGCGTCRRRKKKCDEAKPECEIHSMRSPLKIIDIITNDTQAIIALVAVLYARVMPARSPGRKTV